MIKAYMNWSGGKDCSMALHRLLLSGGYDLKYLLTTCSEAYDRVSMHGVRSLLMQQQADAIGLPLMIAKLPEKAGMETYNKLMSDTVAQLKQQDIYTAAFGDIFLEDLRQYREDQLSQAGIKAVFPLWKEDTSTLAAQFIQLGFKAIVVCVNEHHLPSSFAGRAYDESFLNDLPSTVDPCGENGEFHTFVWDGPIFKHPLAVRRGEVIRSSYPLGNGQPDAAFWYADLIQM